MNQKTIRPLATRALTLKEIPACASILTLVVAGCGSADVEVPSTSGGSHSATSSASTGTGGTGAGGAGGGGSSSGGAGGTVDCSAPQVTLLASGQSNPTLIAVDEVAIYWVSSNPSDDVVHIMTLPKSGGTPAEVAAVTDVEEMQIVADETRLYWHATTSPVDSGPQKIYSVLKTGGPVTLVHTLSVPPRGLAVDLQSLYWFDNTGEVWSLPKAGGDQMLLGKSVEHLPTGKLSLSDERVYWLAHDQAIARVRKSGGDVSLVPNAFEPVYSFVMDEANTFASTTPSPGEYEVVRVPKKTWSPTTIIKLEYTIHQLEQSAECLYWMAENAGLIQAAPKAGGKPITILNNPEIKILRIFADDAGVYWGDYMNGTISKATK